MAAAPFNYNDEVKKNLYAGWNNDASIQQDWNQYGADKYLGYITGGGTPFGERTETRLGLDTKGMQTLAERKRMDAIKPAIESYNATKPEISKLYETERTRLSGNKQPLTDRYQSLLDQIKGKETTATNRQTLTTNNEMAKRGITNDSGVYQQEMTNVLNPITSEYAGLTKDTTLAREEGLKGIDDAITQLTGAESSDLRSLTQLIANMQAGAGNASVDDYLGLAQQNTQNVFNQQNFNEQVRQSNIAEALKRLELEQGGKASNPYLAVSEGQSIINPLTGQLIYNQPKTYKATSSAAGGGAWG